MIHLGKEIKKRVNSNNICIAGGVALNCKANGKIWESCDLENIFIQPFSSDAGLSLGAALMCLQENGISPRLKFTDVYLGPGFTNEEIEAVLQLTKLQYEKLSNIEQRTAQLIRDGNIVGWFQGRMEAGPRALGARSIIADPRSESMQKNLNLKVKYRESFRPFAPSIIRENVSEWFDINCDSPYMLTVANVSPEKCVKMNKDEEQLFGIEKLNIKRSEIPAVTHVDYSARIQTVNKDTNLKYHKLISEFNKKTGCPIVVNTSFNVRGEPIVHSPEDAFKCFMGTEIDVLAIGNCFLKKEKQNMKLKDNYKNKYELD